MGCLCEGSCWCLANSSQDEVAAWSAVRKLKEHIKYYQDKCETQEKKFKEERKLRELLDCVQTNRRKMLEERIKKMEAGKYE